MKKVALLSLACVVAGFMLVACERGTVHAGREEGPYQPKPAPKAEVAPGRSQWNQQMKGELTRVDMRKKTFGVRAENGMEQTFAFNDQTTVQGIEPPLSQKPQAINRMTTLVGKEGSEVTVDWWDENGVKTAASVDVTQNAPKKRLRRKS